MIEIIGPALNQWDTGRVVHITGIEAEYAHFANKGDSKAVILGIVDTHAKIPDFLLQTGKQLCVYAVKDGITVGTRTFYVQKRERPENYVYEDDQRNYIYELIQNAQTAADNATAVAGTTITDGYGVSWDSADSTKTGYSGFVATEKGSGKAETPAEMFKMCKMVILAIGTNDFGNHAPLGTVSDTGTTTFYGAFRAWLNYFQTHNPNLPIIVVTPFKRDTWATPNDKNLILPDYVRAMYVVAREFKHVYLLDVFSKWYGDTDNQVIRARNSIDGIHPSAWFHDCFTMDLVQKIKEVCALEGIIA